MKRQADAMDTRSRGAVPKQLGSNKKKPRRDLTKQMASNFGGRTPPRHSSNASVSPSPNGRVNSDDRTRQTHSSNAEVSPSQNSQGAPMRPASSMTLSSQSIPPTSQLYGYQQTADVQVHQPNDANSSARTDVEDVVELTINEHERSEMEEDAENEIPSPAFELHAGNGQQPPMASRAGIVQPPPMASHSANDNTDYQSLLLMLKMQA